MVVARVRIRRATGTGKRTGAASTSDAAGRRTRPATPACRSQRGACAAQREMHAAMTHPKRPLSPHLQVYRWQITMVMSILHRATGIALVVGAFGLAWWLLAVAAGGEAYASA